MLCSISMFSSSTLVFSLSFKFSIDAVTTRNSDCKKLRATANKLWHFSKHFFKNSVWKIASSLNQNSVPGLCEKF